MAESIHGFFHPHKIRSSMLCYERQHKCMCAKARENIKLIFKIIINENYHFNSVLCIHKIYNHLSVNCLKITFPNIFPLEYMRENEHLVE